MGNTNKWKNAREHFRLSVQWPLLLNSQWLILGLNKKQRCHRHSNSLVLTILQNPCVRFMNKSFRFCEQYQLIHWNDSSQKKNLLANWRLWYLASFRYLAGFYQRFPSKFTEPHTTCIKKKKKNKKTVGMWREKMREQMSKSWNQIHIRIKLILYGDLVFYSTCHVRGSIIFDGLLSIKYTDNIQVVHDFDMWANHSSENLFNESLNTVHLFMNVIGI